MHACISPFVRARTAQTSMDEIVEIVFGALTGSIIVIAGAPADQILLALDEADRSHDDRLALFVPLKSATSAEQIVEQIADVLAETALRVWPVWFTDVDFGCSRADTLGREAARIMAQQVAANTPAVLRPWAEAAVLLALDGRKPRVPGTATAIELAQLCVAINRAGLILLFDTEAAQAHPPALVHALEWVSQNARAAVVALFPELPDYTPPYERILHGAVCTAGMPYGINPTLPEETIAGERPWLVPVRGIPHPLGETEQRLAKALARDGELAPLFGFNQFVETVRGRRPKVDLLWSAGRLVVELDGYADHGTRVAFMNDRHRDYELTLSGYTVLRLANDEIAQDIEKAVEKIRDLVQLCRARTA
jgi:very-short-patch-repair endonuclease